jgi:hypothetical protein
MIQKTTRRIASALALYAISCAGAYAAAEFQYFVYPVGGITGISQSAGKVDSPGPKYGGMINEKYADLFFDAATQQALIQSFKNGVARQLCDCYGHQPFVNVLQHVQRFHPGLGPDHVHSTICQAQRGVGGVLKKRNHL